MTFLKYLIIINLNANLSCLFDKVLAIKHKYRLPESYLLILSLVGGSYGFLVGMHTYHHKTRKLKFKLVYPLAIIWTIILLKLYT